MNNTTHYYAGQWHASPTDAADSDIISVNPATEEQLWHGQAADAGQIDAAIDAAREAFKSWSRTSIEERTAMMRRYQEILKARKDELAQAISDETGKQLWESKTEAATMIGKVDLSIAAYEQRTGTQAKDLNGINTVLTHRPHGVLLVLGPYNFPGHLPNGHIVPALLAGNVILFKPSEITPLVGQKLIECLVEAGLPAGVVSLLQGGGNTGALLSGHADIDGVLFTGSSRTGAALHKQFAGQPQKLLALEMGGNNPLIFHQVDDIKAAVYHTIQSAFITSGQRCTCARRLIVVDDEAGREFVAQLSRAIGNIKAAMPNDDPEAFIGPVVSNHVADQLMQAQQTMLDSGATALVAMRRDDPATPLLTPGLLDVTEQQSREDEEYFGPLLQLIWVENFDSAIEQANDTRFGLAAGILTDDDELWQEFYLRAHAGILNRNRPTTGASGGAPFGGVGASGNHRPSAFYAADYCAYPMATMSDDRATLPETLSTGITL
ncbi:MAG: succinylglutamate-semialdehyde dehydrogenase [Pseudomonadota bacterium]